MKINKYLVEDNEDDYSEDTSKYKFHITSIDSIQWQKSDKKVKQQLIEYLSNINLKIAAKFLDKFKPEFVVYYAECAGKNALADKENIFLNFINNSNASAVITNEKSFVTIFNLLRSSYFDNNKMLDWIRKGNKENCILFYPDLYKTVDSQSKLLTIIKIDFDNYTSSSVSESLIVEEDELRRALSNGSIDTFLRNYRDSKNINKKEDWEEEISTAVKSNPNEAIATLVKGLNISDEAATNLVKYFIES